MKTTANQENIKKRPYSRNSTESVAPVTVTAPKRQMIPPIPSKHEQPEKNSA